MVNSKALAMLQEKKRWYEGRIQSFGSNPDGKLVDYLKDWVEALSIAISAIERGVIIDGEEIVPVELDTFIANFDAVSEAVFSNV